MQQALKSLLQSRRRTVLLDNALATMGAGLPSAMAARMRVLLTLIKAIIRLLSSPSLRATAIAWPKYSCAAARSPTRSSVSPTSCKARAMPRSTSISFIRRTVSRAVTRASWASPKRWKTLARAC
ncbi:MAG TPA: hypothetical protein EYP98_05715 [Planctomycetes bacterium]|nr:hypothetical protein [Planctomycetota bacterium]